MEEKREKEKERGTKREWTSGCCGGLRLVQGKESEQLEEA